MSAPKTASQLTAALVADTCVAMVKGGQPTAAPAEGQELLPDQRARLGLPMEGLVVVYEVGDAQVFLHFLNATATVGYSRGDIDKGPAAVDAALKRSHPTLRQQRDIEHPNGGKKRLRVYEGDLSPERHCTVEVDYPVAGAEALSDKRFVVRVTAFQRPGAKKKVVN